MTGMTGMTGMDRPADVLAPVGGRVVGLGGVPDPVFAKLMAGRGTAVEPIREPLTALAPVAGRVAVLHPHAFVIVDRSDRGILVHLGIDTVELDGAGFELLVGEGMQVTVGQHMVRWNPAEVEAGGRSPVCPVVALDAPADALARVVETGRVAPGDPLFTWK